ncbi:hypothetical protein [Streptomyces sp. TE33382]
MRVRRAVRIAFTKESHHDDAFALDHFLGHLRRSAGTAFWTARVSAHSLAGPGAYRSGRARSHRSP